ncbi:MAG: NADPH:quinone reductase [Thermoleophilaceae bacterium]|nr:NADPH:quinone reductase [Thermoleophilaceae bacterium]
MRAVQVSELDGPDAARVVDVDEPKVEGAMTIEVHAAGISFPDVLMTRGLYQYKPEPPFILGSEAAGVVISTPDGSGFSEGDRVASMTLGGTFAERAAVMPQMTFALPDELSFEEGAAYVLNYHTAHFGLLRRGRLEQGETLLVHGAAGGVGTAAIQVAKAVRARVIGVVSTDEKERVAREAGADEVVRSDGAWKDEAKELSGGGVDVVFDPVGGDRFLDSVRSLRDEGRLVVIGFTEGSIPSIAVNRLLLRNVSVVGAGWGAFAIPRPEYAREVAADLDRMVSEGHVKPIIGKTYALDEVPQALRDIDERRALGKLVLDVAG